MLISLSSSLQLYSFLTSSPTVSEGCSWAFLRRGAEVSLTACGRHLQQEILGEGSVLDIGKDLLHGLLGLLCDNLGSGDVVAVLSGIGDGVSHALEAGLIDQIHDQLHLMDALEIRVSGIVSCLYQGLEACLHQSADTAAENCLLAEQVGLRLHPEGSLQHAGAGAADAQGIGQSQILGFAGVILLYGNQTGNAFSCFILASHGMSGPFGSDHGHIHVGRRNDLAEMDGKTVSEHQHIALLQVGLNVLFVHCGLLLIVDQNHDNIRLLCCLCRGVDLQALSFCLGPGFAALVKAHNNITAGILQVQRMGVSLASVADDSDLFSFQ